MLLTSCPSLISVVDRGLVVGALHGHRLMTTQAPPASSAGECTVRMMPSYAIGSIKTWIMALARPMQPFAAVGSSRQTCCRRIMYVCEVHSGSEGTWLSLLMHVSPVELDDGLQLEHAENFQPSLWAMDA